MGTKPQIREDFFQNVLNECGNGHFWCFFGRIERQKYFRDEWWFSLWARENGPSPEWLSSPITQPILDFLGSGKGKVFNHEYVKVIRIPDTNFKKVGQETFAVLISSAETSNIR